MYPPHSTTLVQKRKLFKLLYFNIRLIHTDRVTPWNTVLLGALGGAVISASNLNEGPFQNSFEYYCHVCRWNDKHKLKKSDKLSKSWMCWSLEEARIFQYTRLPPGSVVSSKGLSIFFVESGKSAVKSLHCRSCNCWPISNISQCLSSSARTGKFLSKDYKSEGAMSPSLHWF